MIETAASIARLNDSMSVMSGTGVPRRTATPKPMPPSRRTLARSTLPASASVAMPSLVAIKTSPGAPSVTRWTMAPVVKDSNFTRLPLAAA